jgi:hypothetical protein
MSKRDVVAVVVLALSGVVVGVGCLATYGVLREYADVCEGTGPVEQVWLGGAGLGPLVAGIAVVFALVVAFIARRRGVRVAAVGLVIVALVGATASGAAGVSDKKAAWDKNPSTYGVCGGYNS